MKAFSNNQRRTKVDNDRVSTEPSEIAQAQNNAKNTVIVNQLMNQYRTMDQRGHGGYPEIKTDHKQRNFGHQQTSIVSNEDSSRQSLRHYRARIEREISVKYTHNPEKPRGIYIENKR